MSDIPECVCVVPDQDVCKLYCFAEGYDFFFALSSKVRDGTLCTQDGTDVCIDGICEVMYNIHNFEFITLYNLRSLVIVSVDIITIDTVWP